jgi:phosphohistidine phosphatase
MQLFLVRHAHAVAMDDDAARPLSEAGRVATTRLGAFLRGTGVFRPAQVWHSPLVRARETADGLVAALDPELMVVETDDLLPEDDPVWLARRLEIYPTTHDLALVGHEPHLAALATLLVRGKVSPVMFNLKKGAVIALERTERVHKASGRPRWRVRWMVGPELLGTGGGNDQ